MQGYQYDSWTIKFWTVKFPGDICIVEIWTVKTGLGLQLQLGLRLVMTVQFMTVQILTVQFRHVTREQKPPLFGPCLLSSNGWMDQDAICLVWTMEVRVGPDHVVLDGNPAPHKGHGSPLNFGGVYCGQMAGWIKMPLGTEVGLSACNIVLDDTYR